MDDIGNGLGHKERWYTAAGRLLSFIQSVACRSKLCPSRKRRRRLVVRLTACNALCGLRGREVKERSLSAGPMEREGEEKAERWKKLDAHVVINYRSTPEWGTAAGNLTPEERVLNIVVDVGGAITLPQALKAVTTDGLIIASSILSGQIEIPVPMMKALWTLCTVRGNILLALRQSAREMVGFVKQHNIAPVFDAVVFGISEVKEAHLRLETREHLSKVSLNHTL